MPTEANIYIVDDDELVLSTLDSIFTFAGFEVFTFNRAEDFLATDLSDAPGCLILDLRMPHMSGLELQRHLAKRQLQLPVIIYTGNADVATTVRAMSDGAFTLIQKPISNDLLVETVRDAIQQHQERFQKTALYQQARDQLACLSEKERQVAILAADGLTAADISKQLHVSIRTVEAHKSNIFKKLNIHSIAQLTRLVVLAELTH
ncbi:two component transcriptional regulator, LuxR family [Marinospirillum celere]|uniref:Two component transcriptional regulator, LuxR family n=1 Tax=Marinospirillum celere TaxID=1122252 RepID=A0A1I1HSS2_9GAMM|nr:response regulator [Marinospirillum celere]SFC27179.1 two component transcriptional regulator, LuxR family [Marinospirillum celere]